MALNGKIKKLFKVVNIEVYIYVLTNDVFAFDSSTAFVIHKSKESKKIVYIVYDGTTVVHKSFLYTNVHILKLINESGFVIGSCFTNPNYRGQCIFPKVISHIAKDNKDVNELFLIVDIDNYSSIKGIEKAGYKRVAYIKTKKWLLFYFNTKIKMSN